MPPATSGAQTDYQAGQPNIATITTPAGQDDVWQYFGCFLNFYDPANIVAGQQVQAYLLGTHHCVVAQIAYDGAPTHAGASPMSWDQLAQRNLQFTVVDNPGPAATHRAPQTFDIRPSGAIGKPDGAGAGMLPDVLMIDWGAVPAGTTASVYWPAVSAADVIALARTWGGAAEISATDAQHADAHGRGRRVLPTGPRGHRAELRRPPHPRAASPASGRGQEFEVLVRRLSTRVTRHPRRPRGRSRPPDQARRAPPSRGP